MFDFVLPSKTKQLADKLTNKDFPNGTYLAGGTAIALQIGHRQSLDLDFFSPEEFQEDQWEQKFARDLSFSTVNKDLQTLIGNTKGVKLSLFGYHYPLIGGLLPYEQILIASLPDLGAMKLDTLTRRGTKRDFIDLYFLCNNFGLSKMFSFYDKKYKNLYEKELMIKKALIYFDDAESDEMPNMIKEISWEEVKQYFINEL